MPRGKKRTAEDYDREIAEAAKRIRKRPEALRSARSSSVWLDFLRDIGVETTETDSGQKFWNDVRARLQPRLERRRNIYAEARQAGMPAKLARRIRDWSSARAELEIERWEARY